LLSDGQKPRLARDGEDSGMFERVAHSGAATRQRITIEALIKFRDVAAAEDLGKDCETLRLNFGLLYF
jgi:hypothetical protein